MILHYSLMVPQVFIEPGYHLPDSGDLSFDQCILIQSILEFIPQLLNHVF